MTAALRPPSAKALPSPTTTSAAAITPYSPGERKRATTRLCTNASTAAIALAPTVHLAPAAAERASGELGGVLVIVGMARWPPRQPAPRRGGPPKLEREHRRLASMRDRRAGVGGHA